MSNFDRLLNAMKQHGGGMLDGLGQPRFGIVASYDPNTGAAKVRLQPEDVLTGWLPVLSPWVGAGWGMHAPLTGGEQVLVVMQDGDGGHGVIVGRTWSDAMRPPAAAPGELRLQHQSGAYIRLSADGGVSIFATNDITVQAMSKVNVVAPEGMVVTTTILTVNGDLIVSGDITDQDGAHHSLADLRLAYDTHTHTDPQGGTTGLPTPQVT